MTRANFTPSAHCYHRTFYNRARRELLKRGDLGSLVLNNAGHVVGLLIGGSTTKNVTYFTHLVELITDIKQATGTKAVRLMGSDVSY